MPFYFLFFCSLGLSSVKSTTPVVPNEELYMELDLDNINTDDQYCDLETMRNSISLDSGPFHNPNFKMDQDESGVNSYPAYFDTETDGPIYNEIPIYFETYMEQPNGQ